MLSGRMRRRHHSSDGRDECAQAHASGDFECEMNWRLSGFGNPDV